jgi:hypothetical protein
MSLINMKEAASNPGQLFLYTHKWQQWSLTHTKTKAKKAVYSFEDQQRKNIGDHLFVSPGATAT